ncbi:hypothetical protein OIDMADRAFT_21621 [Oidiodendron maius Zn]|uniref:Uncharacterized protein n=1 Tax=Oidiodendron maius (strain Zn) TaxID=913774 RepID=A0A0C3CTG9_OIDMZ|nr:hypothetical protein OIDMADRAFT_21621 [Oidiodendron maius Zn]
MGYSVDAEQANSLEIKLLPLLTDYRCSILSPESGALLSCMQPVIEEGPVNISTEASGRIDTIEMNMDTALGTSIGLFPSVIITRHLTERTSTFDSAEPLLRSSHSDIASHEELESYNKHT